MREIAIVGAGQLGGIIAYGLARRNAAATVRIIDAHGHVAEGKALDITQCAPLSGSAVTVVGSTDVMTAAAADIIIVADRADRGEWQGEEGTDLMGRLARLAPAAIVLCAGHSQRGLVEEGARLVPAGRERTLGTAPEALAGAARALVALAVDGSARDVALSLLGVPPSRIVIPWNDATLAGFAVTSLISEPMRRQLDHRIAGLWPPGPYALAAAVTNAVDAIDHRTRAVLCCFVAPDDTAGRRTRTAALPVRLGPEGLERVVLPTLEVVDRIALDNAMLL
jgi:malate/lactate dehydrogenase